MGQLHSSRIIYSWVYNIVDSLKQSNHTQLSFCAPHNINHQVGELHFLTSSTNTVSIIFIHKFGFTLPVNINHEVGEQHLVIVLP